MAESIGFTLMSHFSMRLFIWHFTWKREDKVRIRELYDVANDFHTNYYTNKFSTVQMEKKGKKVLELVKCLKVLKAEITNNRSQNFTEFKTICLSHPKIKLDKNVFISKEF